MRYLTVVLLALIVLLSLPAKGQGIQVVDDIVLDGIHVVTFCRSGESESPFVIQSISVSNGRTRIWIEAPADPLALQDDLSQWEGEVQEKGSDTGMPIGIRLKKKCSTDGTGGYIKNPEDNCPSDHTVVDWFIQLGCELTDTVELAFGLDPDYLVLMERNHD